ncbi:MAG: gluconate 2-dehydrogenase subunit 3 family protein [Balneolaceae bacterium]|nr:gluconate 2-dehydrogenase subunit 3 family protein [Balneolaceae bacterium]
MSTDKKKISRREAIKTLSLGTLAGGYLITACDPAPEQPFGGKLSAKELEKWKTQFFTDHEYETVRVLANMIIPADDRSGNAEQAGVPDFIDFMMLDRPEIQTPMRGGLQWLDAQCNRLFGNSFIDCSEQERREMLDEIAYPEQASSEMLPGVRFFNRMRDLTASGFWSSKIGIEDIQYLGNRATNWNGCPEKALKHIGVSYD